MRFLFVASVLIINLFSPTVEAQNADQVIEQYLEAIGGEEALRQVQGLTIKATFKFGDLEAQAKQVTLKDGRRYSSMTIGDSSFESDVFDGEHLWGINVQSGLPELSDQEAVDNLKLDLNDFPEGLLDYKEKGYEVTLNGTKEIDGVKTIGITVKKEDKTLNGEVQEDLFHFYFHPETHLILSHENMIWQGPNAGQWQTLFYDDYQEVSEGYIMPFYVKFQIGEDMFEFFTTEIEMNPIINAEIFKFPGN